MGFHMSYEMEAPFVFFFLVLTSTTPKSKSYYTTQLKSLFTYLSIYLHTVGCITRVTFTFHLSMVMYINRKHINIPETYLKHNEKHKEQ